jgi:hypothetical protein
MLTYKLHIELRFLLFCVGIGLCDGLVTRPEESYRMCQLYVIKKPEWLRKNLSSKEKS